MLLFLRRCRARFLRRCRAWFLQRCRAWFFRRCLAWFLQWCRAWFLWGCFTWFWSTNFAPNIKKETHWFCWNYFNSLPCFCAKNHSNECVKTVFILCITTKCVPVSFNSSSNYYRNNILIKIILVFFSFLACLCCCCFFAIFFADSLYLLRFITVKLQHLPHFPINNKACKYRRIC